MIDLTNTDLTAKTAVELRKIGAEAGIKAASKGKKADLLAALIPMQDAQRAERDAKTAAALKSTKGTCGICGKRRNYTGPGEKAPRLSEMCNPCFAEGGWENTHSDANHEAILATPEADRTPEQLDEIDGCWICYPELNLAKAEPKAGRSRAGMVIVAKGTEVHKSNTFKVAAEAKGWTVSILGSVVTGEDDEEIERFVAVATKGADRMELAWNGRAYDYPSSNATLAGKGRKVRNLKEALRML